MRELDCDILIVGSGAAGGTLAATLSELTRKRIVLVEKGGHFARTFFNQREWDMNTLYAEEGARGTADGAIAVRGGQCVGGGTTVNIALCFDPVPSVWEGWRRAHGLRGFSFDSAASDYGVPGLNMPACLAEVRRRIHVHAPADAEINANNRFFERGCRALGISARRFELNMDGCIGCGYCAQGCAYDAKRGTMVTYIADALERGVQLVHHCEVERVEMRGGRAVGALARVRPTRAGSLPNSVAPGSLRIRAGLVIVSAGAIESPSLLARSGHPDPHQVLGRGLVLHPSLPIISRTSEEVVGYRGITGSYYSDHFYQSDGFYLECLFGHPVYGAVVLPRFGTAHFELMLELRRLAGFGVMLVDTVDAHNRVEWDRVRERPLIHYRLGEDDARRLRFAAQKAVEVAFAAGAREVLIPSEEPVGQLDSPRFSDPAQARLCSELRFLSHQTTLTSSHCQATAKMGEDPRRSVVDSRGESHQVQSLLVCDSSTFPASCGANPMVSIMTLARYQGRRIAAELARYAL